MAAAALFGLTWLLPPRMAPATEATAATATTEATEATDRELGGPASSPATAERSAAAASVEAQAHYDRGLALYAARDFGTAISELERAFAIDPRPEFLFAEAQALRLAGDCARAVPLYDRFLGAAPTPLQIQATRLALARCPLEPATVPGSTRSATATTATAATTVTATTGVNATRGAAHRPRFWADPWALASIGAGVVAAGVGAGYAVASERARDEARSPATASYSEFSRLWETAGQRRTIAVVSLAGGGVLLAAGMVRLLVIGRRVGATAIGPDGVPAPGSRASAASGPSLSVLPGGAAFCWEVAY